MNKVVIASKNKHKLEEIKEILKDFSLDIKSMDEVGLADLEVIEDGNTFEENAMKKAQEVMKASGHIAIADDSGLEVEAIGNKPGVYSARFAGENASDQENNQKLLRLLEGIPFEKRNAKFVSVIAVAFPDGRKISVRGEIPGKIGYEEKGENGFGYDPLFIVEEFQKTFAEMPPFLKNKISHRARALEKLKKELKNFI
ncbi:MAG TPA: XTP/dITP diphosphatase [Clostridiales bacterium]|nr:XTP/dITP diphosphatase [Clostridiales bacterium]